MHLYKSDAIQSFHVAGVPAKCTKKLRSIFIHPYVAEIVETHHLSMFVCPRVGFGERL